MTLAEAQRSVGRRVRVLIDGVVETLEVDGLLVGIEGDAFVRVDGDDGTMVIARVTSVTLLQESGARPRQNGRQSNT